jgi:hypothetical protein
MLVKPMFPPMILSAPSKALAFKLTGDGECD